MALVYPLAIRSQTTDDSVFGVPDDSAISDSLPTVGGYAILDIETREDCDGAMKWASKAVEFLSQNRTFPSTELYVCDPHGHLPRKSRHELLHMGAHLVSKPAQSLAREFNRGCTLKKKPVELVTETLVTADA